MRPFLRRGGLFCAPKLGTPRPSPSRRKIVTLRAWGGTGTSYARRRGNARHLSDERLRYLREQLCQLGKMSETIAAVDHVLRTRGPVTRRVAVEPSAACPMGL